MQKKAGADSFKDKLHGIRIVPQQGIRDCLRSRGRQEPVQNRWEVIVCPNIVAQIGQHMAEDHCLQVRRDDAAAQYATSATRPRERLTLGVELAN